MRFESETEIIGLLQACGSSYSTAVLLNRMVKEKWDIAEEEFKKLGGTRTFQDIYKFHHDN